MRAKFSTEFDPPAPIGTVTIRNRGTGERSNEIEMLLDTGSDISLLPLHLLELLQVRPSPVKRFDLIGFEGTEKPHEIFDTQVVFLGKRFTGNYCAIDDTIGILGRDVLNKFAFIFDGPNLEWDVVEPASDLNTTS
ncbi:MAG: hypothetical protein ACRD6X_11940 [Pyrinomonadaceae bacterium]